MSTTKRTLKLAGLAALLSIVIPQARAELNIIDQNNWKLQMSGFAETDFMSDSTRSFREVVGNNPVSRGDTAAGNNSRAQMSIRNSRLAFTITPPTVGDWKSKAYMEFDLLGYEPAAGSASGNTEAGLYNNPTFRARHAYFKTESEGWEILAGQTWELFGWQPYYFMPSVDVAPLPAMTYGRTVQVRVTKAVDVGGENMLQTSFAVGRPPQGDAGLPDLQAGLRLAFCCRGSGYMGGGASARKIEPMSIAVSGVYRSLSIPSSDANVNDTTTFQGSAFSANVFIPILASDDKSVSNTLSLTGSYTSGTGYGDQFVGFTGNSANPLNTAANLTSGAKKFGPSIDGGIGDYDNQNNFNLVQITSYNVNLQYHLPNEMPDWVSAGFGVLTSNNIDSLVGTNGLTSASAVPYDRERVYYGNYFHEFSPQLRLGAEYAYIDTEYGDGATATDRRYQLSAFFIF